MFASAGAAERDERPSGTLLFCLYFVLGQTVMWLQIKRFSSVYLSACDIHF